MQTTNRALTTKLTAAIATLNDAVAALEEKNLATPDATVKGAAGDEAKNNKAADIAKINAELSKFVSPGTKNLGQLVVKVLREEEGKKTQFQRDGVQRASFLEVQSGTVTEHANITFTEFSKTHIYTPPLTDDQETDAKCVIKAALVNGFKSQMKTAKTACRHIIVAMGTFGSNANNCTVRRSSEEMIDQESVQKATCATKFAVNLELLKNLNIRSILCVDTTAQNGTVTQNVCCVNVFNRVTAEVGVVPTLTPVVDTHALDYDLKLNLELSTTQWLNLGLPMGLHRPISTTNPGFLSSYALLETAVMLFGYPILTPANSTPERFNRQTGLKGDTKTRISTIKESNNASFVHTVPDGFVLSKYQVSLAVSVLVDTITAGNETNQELKDAFGITETRTMNEVKEAIQRNTLIVCDLIEGYQTRHPNRQICAFRIKTPAVAPVAVAVAAAVENT